MRMADFKDVFKPFDMPHVEKHEGKFKDTLFEKNLVYEDERLIRNDHDRHIRERIGAK